MFLILCLKFLVLWFMYISLYLVYCFVPMLFSLVLVVKCYAFSLSTSLLCPCWILYPWCNYFEFFVSVECWTCKWYFVLSLLACMFGCSFLVWMIIVITIYSDCSCMVKSCFIAIFFTTWSHCGCSIYISRFLLTMIVLCYCFQEKFVRIV